MMSYVYPKAKVDKFLALLQSAFALYYKALAVPYKLLHSIEGSLTAMHLAVSPIMLWARDIAVIRTRGVENGSIHLAEQEVARLKEIPGVIKENNGAPIRPLRAEVFANVDAGGVGLGAKVMAPRGGPGLPPAEFAEALEEQEMTESSTLRELLALKKLLVRRGQEFRARVLRVYFDSANAVRNLVKGGTTKNARQHQICKDIFELCKIHLITLQPDWVPRGSNERADILSKIFDRGTLTPSTLAKLLRHFGQAHVIVPTFTNVTHGVLAGARGHERLVVVAPKWRTQVWWPTLMALGEKTGQAPLALGKYSDIFVRDTAHKPPANWTFMAVRVNAHDVQAALGKAVTTS